MVTEMAEIRPFCGIRYDQRLAGDMAAVICPPYDIISPQMQHELYQRSQYNFVRIEDSSSDDSAAGDRYTRAAATLEGWLGQGVLKVDELPAVYLYDQHFTLQGSQYRRRGITCAVRLEGWEKMVVRPHEGTLTEPKKDRLNLLWALQANTSPILALFEDRGQQVSSLLASQEKSEPVISVSGAGGEGHRVWALTGPGVIDRLSRSLADQPLYIADGHHRYESALAYQRERRACSPQVASDEPFDFVMMTLVDFADPGLVILPPHRLVRGVPPASLSQFAGRLRAFFKVRELLLSTPGAWRQLDDFLAEEAGGARLGLSAGERLLLLELSDPAGTSRMMPYFHSELYKSLAVSVVDHVILEKLLGLDATQTAAIAYSYDKLDAVNRVQSGEYQMALLLGPARPQVIKAIADAGDRMPRKSTYFYPKLPAGLVCYRLA